MDTRQYIDEIKLIFIHIPKTGGSFIERILKILASKLNSSFSRNFGSHFSINLYGSEFKDYTSFVVDRNPYDRLYSAFYHIFSNRDSSYSHNTLKKLNFPLNFSEFVNNLYLLFEKEELPWMNKNMEEIDKLSSSSLQFMVHVYPQFFYCIDHQEKIAVDHILYYESLSDGISKMANIFQNHPIVFNTFQNNILSNIHIRPSYKICEKYPELVPKINSIYEKDFEYFGYEKK